MLRSVPRFLAAIFLSWLLAIPAFADLTGDVQGTVTDASGARVADAKVTIKNIGTGATRTVTTGSEGEFSIPQLQIGAHLITVEKDGFKTFSQQVVVRSGEKTRADVVMQLGNVAESVTVESSATPALDLATAQVSDSISEQVALALPNQARDPVVYATLSPGTVPVSKDNPFLGVGSFNSNGSRGRANNITLDGVTGTDISTTGEGGGLVLSQDAVSEVKVITNNFDAEFGRNSGSQVQILTKSGTNNYHGSAFWYYQNNDLGNARDFFDQTGSPAPINQNQEGGTFGAPIYLLLWERGSGQHPGRRCNGHCKRLDAGAGCGDHGPHDPCAVQSRRFSHFANRETVQQLSQRIERRHLDAPNRPVAPRRKRHPQREVRPKPSAANQPW